MRFSLQPTSDGSLTVYDSQAGECFKSRHAAATEAEHVFFAPGILENPWYGTAKPFRVLELGLGLGTNFLHCLSRGFPGEFLTIERDLSGLEFYLRHQPEPALRALVNEGRFEEKSFCSRLVQADFTAAMKALAAQNYQAHALFFDPFSPKANPGCWTPEFFRLAASLLAPGGRLVTYSVSRSAKDAAAAAGLAVEKHKLPDALKKRSALLAIKPSS